LLIISFCLAVFVFPLALLVFLLNFFGKKAPAANSDEKIEEEKRLKHLS